MENVILGKYDKTYESHSLLTDNVTDNGLKEVNEIRLFDKDGIKHSFGWFVDSPGGYHNINHEVTIDIELKRKIKEDFSLNCAFYRSYKGAFDSKKGRVILYIPLSALDIVEYDRKTIKFKFETKPYDTVIYKVKELNAFFTQQRENKRTTKESIRNKKIIKIIEYSPFENMKDLIRNHFDDLKKLVNNIEEVKKDSYNINDKC